MGSLLTKSKATPQITDTQSTNLEYMRENSKLIAQWCCNKLVLFPFKVSSGYKINTLFDVLIFFIKDGEVTRYINNYQHNKMIIDIIHDQKYYYTLDGYTTSNYSVMTDLFKTFYKKKRSYYDDVKNDIFLDLNVECPFFILKDIYNIIGGYRTRMILNKTATDKYGPFPNKNDYLNHILKQTSDTIASELSDDDKRLKIKELSEDYETISNIEYHLNNEQYDIFFHNYDVFSTELNRIVRDKYE